MKERMSGIGGNGNDFEGNPDGGIGATGLDVPKRCEEWPYAEGVTREHAADVGLEETEAAQREIDQVTVNCHGPVTATVESRSSEGTVVKFVGCDSPTLDEGKRTGEYVSFDRHNPDLALEQARQAVSALRRSLLPDNDDGSEEGKYVTPPHWIEEIRGASDDES